MLEPVRRFLDGDLSIAPCIRVEQFQEGSTLVVRAEVPGIDPDQDVDVSVSEGMLHITAERQEKSEHKSKDGYRSEFRYGSFCAVALPPGQGRRHHRHLQGRVLEVRHRPQTAPDTTPRKSGSTTPAGAARAYRSRPRPSCQRPGLRLRAIIRRPRW